MPIPPIGVTESELRVSELPPPEFVGGIPLYPVGGTVFIYGPPGVGKSFVQQGLNHTLTWGKPLGPWQPEVLSNVLYCDLEGNARLSKERSLALTPLGMLPSDTGGTPMDTDTTYLFCEDFTGRSFGERLSELEDALKIKEDHGIGYSLVVIDTYGFFIGSRPGDMTADDYDRLCISALNKIAETYQVCIVLIHHPNKRGEMSGSTARAGTAFVVLRFTESGVGVAVLETEKNRLGRSFSLCFEWDKERIWRLATDIVPAQALSKGNNRIILNALVAAGGFMTLGDLRLTTHLPEGSLRSGLYRLSQRGEVEHRDGSWHTTFPVTQEVPTVATYSPWAKCTECRFVMDPDRGCVNVRCDRHDPTLFAVAPPATPMEMTPDCVLGKLDSEPEPVPAVHHNEAIGRLVELVGASRLHPVFKLNEEIKSRLPYSAMCLGGAPNQWSLFPADAPTGRVKSFDRKASYFSSNPWLVPNVLSRTGPLQWADIRAQKLAGAFQIVAPGWPTPWLPNPLGAHVKKHERVMVTRPTLNRFAQLVKEGLLPEFPSVLMGYVGKGSEELLAKWFEWCLEQRRTAGDHAEAARRKADQNVALGSLRIVDDAKNPGVIDRPDWQYAIVAQHYAQMHRYAVKSLTAGEPLIAMGNTDELVYLVPEDADVTEWVPETLRPHVQANRFAVKYVYSADDWYDQGGRLGSRTRTDSAG